MYISIPETGLRNSRYESKYLPFLIKIFSDKKAYLFSCEKKLSSTLNHIISVNNLSLRKQPFSSFGEVFIG